MDALIGAGIIFAAALVVLAAVVASGRGPLGSLRRSAGRMRDVSDEAERLRRNLEVLRQRRARLGRHPEGSVD